MELRHLRYFVAVAEERHFGRAAARLRIAQPPLSRQIQALEAELGFALFDRTGRRVELTAAGAKLHEETRRVFAALEHAVSEARRASRGESGHIRVGYLSTFANSGLPEVVRAYRTRSPGVEVELRELSPQEQIQALRDGDIDVGFVRAPVDEPGIRSDLVRSEPLVLAVPRGHSLASRKSVDLEKAAREPFVLFPRARGPAYFDLLMRLCHAAGFTPRIVQEAPQLDIVSLVAAGFGVSILPASIRQVRRSGVALLRIVGNPRTELLVVWREHDRSPIIDTFVDVVRRYASAA